MRIITLLIAALTVLVAPGLKAFPGFGENVDTSCQKDYVTLAENKKCSEECHDQSAMDCLQENLKEVSEACRKQISGERKAWEARNKSFAVVQKACAADFKKHDIKGVCHKDSIFNLMVKRAEISQGCKDQANKHISSHLKGIRTMD